jgi:hypothetical protein
MSTETPVSASAKSGKQPRELPKQPSEQFWQRYSAHHEFPLSTVTSVATHFMLAGLIVIIAFYWSPWRQEKEMPLAMDFITPGGGGDPLGSTDNSGTGPAAESDALPPRDDVAKKTNEPVIPVIPDEKPQKDVLPIPTAINFDEYIKNNTAAKDAIAKMSPLDKELVKGLAGGNGQRRQKGLGSGTGGGEGSGVGPGKGSGVGPGEEKMLNKRIERKNRWVMNFSTFDGHDYAKQLEDLGAIVAAPMPGEGGKYSVIKNLARPGKKEVMTDLASLQRIWWTDDNPRSVRELSQALEMKFIPPVLIAFFPQDLEARLADMEMEYAKKHGTMKDVKEEMIGETVFQVKRRGAKYQPEVSEQRYK